MLCHDSIEPLQNLACSKMNYFGDIFTHQPIRKQCVMAYRENLFAFAALHPCRYDSILKMLACANVGGMYQVDELSVSSVPSIKFCD